MCGKRFEVKELSNVISSILPCIQVDWDKKEHHLLGYFPDSEWKRSALSPQMLALQKACAQVCNLIMLYSDNNNEAVCCFLSFTCFSAFHIVLSPNLSLNLLFTTLNNSTSPKLQKVKHSRENRNNMLVEYLNEVLSPDNSDGAIYFKSAAEQQAFVPVEVDKVRKCF